MRERHCLIAASTSVVATTAFASHVAALGQRAARSVLASARSICVVPPRATSAVVQVCSEVTNVASWFAKSSIARMPRQHVFAGIAPLPGAIVQCKLAGGTGLQSTSNCVAADPAATTAAATGAGAADPTVGGGGASPLHAAAITTTK